MFFFHSDDFSLNLIPFGNSDFKVKFREKNDIRLHTTRGYGLKQIHFILLKLDGFYSMISKRKRRNLWFSRGKIRVNLIKCDCWRMWVTRVRELVNLY